MAIRKGVGTTGDPIVRGTASDVIIGNYCSISNYSIFDGGFGHYHENVSQYDWRQMGFESNFHSKTKGDISVGSDVWIGDNAIIMSGVSIGHGAVIAAGSIVTKDVDPYVIVAGVPAKMKKYRFSLDVIEALLDIAWWDWTEDKIRDNINLINNSDIKKFIHLHKTP